MITSKKNALTYFFRMILLLLIQLTQLTLVHTANAYAHADVTFEKDSSLPLVYINVAVRGGSVSDPAQQGGLTNFMGEMLLRGTRSKTKEQIDLILDQMGARLDVEARAEALIFRGAVLSSQLEPYLKLLTEILTRPSFPENEMAKLKSEIISGIQEELGHDGSLASRRFNRFLFQNHPYGRPVIGRVEEIRSFTQAQLLAHYNRLVREQSLMVVGTGDASPSQISDWANELAQFRANADLTALTSEDKRILEKVSAPENSNHRRLLIVDKPDRTQTQINAGQIGLQMTDRDFFPLYLGNYAFGGSSFSAILMTEIRVKRGWSYGAYSNFRFGLQPRSWNIHLFPAAKDTPSALEYSLKLLTDLRSNGITSQQFEFAKQSLVNKAGFMYNTPKKRVENILLEKTLGLPDGFMKSYGAELAKVQLSEVNSSFNRFIKGDRLAITVLGTAKDLKGPLAKAAGIPEEEVEVVPYTED